MAAAEGAGQGTPAFRPQVIAGAFESVLELAQVCLIEGECVTEDRCGILDGIALGQAGIGRCCQPEASGGDQGDQQGAESLMCHGEPRCCLDFGTAV